MGFLDRESPMPLGRLIDIGGYALHLHETGRGSPTVVLVAGGGDFSFDWSLVQPEAAKFTRVCSYDRAGQAWSDPGPYPRTMKQDAYELHLLLQAACVPPPYVLVGHSIGGLIVRLYATAHPESVAGMVLVDPTHENTKLGYQGRIVRVRELSHAGQVPSVQTIQSSPPRLEDASEWQRKFDALPDNIRRAKLHPSIRPPYTQLPEHVHALRLWALRPKPEYVSLDDYLPNELQAIYEERQVNTQTLGDLPLVVIASARQHEASHGVDTEEWKGLLAEKRIEKQDLAALSGRGKLILDPLSGHHIHLDNPEIVVGAIREIIEEVR